MIPSINSKEAHDRIQTYTRETPLEFSQVLSREADCQAYLKLENFQVTGSFKLRGAANKLLSLSPAMKEKGVITASSGNHGVAFAHMTKILGINGTVFLPRDTPKVKIEALRSYDIEIELSPSSDCAAAEQMAREEAERRACVFVSPYNDRLVIEGQSTVAYECSQQQDQIDAVVVPVGGGGLVSGIGLFMKSKFKNTRIIACQPKYSPVMSESLKAGRILQIDSKPTLSDGTSGGIEEDSLTFDICARIIDDFILISEKEIIYAIKWLLEKHHLLIEGAGALSLAAFMKTKKQFKGKNVILIVSGSRIDFSSFKGLLD
jgi:threonine dehydratase